MSKGTNLVIFSGNLGQDPELKYTQGGTAVLNVSVGSTQSFKKGDEWQDNTTWMKVVVWGRRAEGLNKILQKGSFIEVVGRIQTRTWEKSDGSKGYATDIVADNVVPVKGMVDTRGGGGGGYDRSGGGGGGWNPSDDDIPF